MIFILYRHLYGRLDYIIYIIIFLITLCSELNYNSYKDQDGVFNYIRLVNIIYLINNYYINS